MYEDNKHMTVTIYVRQAGQGRELWERAGPGGSTFEQISTNMVFDSKPWSKHSNIHHVTV